MLCITIGYVSLQTVPKEVNCCTHLICRQIGRRKAKLDCNKVDLVCDGQCINGQSNNSLCALLLLCLKNNLANLLLHRLESSWPPSQSILASIAWPIVSKSSMLESSWWSKNSVSFTHPSVTVHFRRLLTGPIVIQGPDCGLFVALIVVVNKVTYKGTMGATVAYHPRIP